LAPQKKKKTFTQIPCIENSRTLDEVETHHRRISDGIAEEYGIRILTICRIALLSIDLGIERTVQRHAYPNPEFMAAG
jgi:hypothetical protein